MRILCALLCAHLVGCDSSPGVHNSTADSAAPAEHECGAVDTQIHRLEELAGCTVALGSVHISDTQLTTFELDAVRSLREVRGGLTFFRNDKLTDTRGFHALEKVGGKFGFSNHAVLEALQGFERLRSVGGQFYLQSN